MKKTYLTRRNALFASGVSVGAYALLFALLCLLVRLSAPNFFVTLVSPAFRASEIVATESRSFFASFENASRLAIDNERLARENQSLALENKALIETLRAIRGLLVEPASIVASVIARPPESAYDTLVLGAGTRAGVTTGMEVFGEAGTPLGVIETVTADFSRATLFSAPAQSTAGWVGSKNFPIILTGVGGGAVTASVPRALGVVVGDTVTVPGPSARILGQVTRVDSVASSPSVTLHIASVLNLFSLSWVAIRDVGVTLKTSLATTSPLQL